MKKILALFSLLCVIQQISAQENKNVIAIGFYNLENFYDTLNDPNKLDDEFTPNGPNAYTPEVFWKKIENLSEVISKMGIDKSKEGIELLGVAEVENQSVLEALCNSPKLKNKHLKSIIFDGPDERSIDCGLLYNPKFFKVLQAKSLTVPFPEGDRPTRDVLFVTGKFHDEVVHIFVNHWPSRRGGEAASRPKRKLAASVSKQVIDSLMKTDPLSKVIVMGDLNDDPIDESVVKVLGAKSKLEDTKAGQLYNPFTSFYKKGIGTLAYQDAWGLFDQIIISYGLAVDKSSHLQFQEAQVFNRRFLIQKDGQYQGYPRRAYIGSTWNDGYSDHFPTVLFFNTK